MKFIDSAMKPVLGHLIKLERENQKLTQKELIMQADSVFICSSSTLHRIESGMLIKDDIIYHELIQNLGYDLIPDSNLNDLIPKLCDQCMHYFETLNLDEAEQILQDIQLLKQTNSFYYVQFAQCFQDLLDVNLNKRRLTEKEYKQYQKMIAFMPEPLNVLLVHQCFCYANNVMQSIKEINMYEDKMIQYKDYLIMRIDVQAIMKYNHRIEEFLSLNSLIIEEAKKRNLINQQCKALASRCNIISIIQKTKLKNLVDKLENLIFKNQNRINNAILSNVLYSISMLYYVDLQNYETARKMFELVLEKDPLKIYACGIFYFSACELCGSRPLTSLINYLNVDECNVYLRYFYFKYQQNWSNSDLVYYLMNDVYRSLKDNYSEIVLKVFKIQWKYVMQIDTKSHYKDYYAFMNAFE